MQGSFTEYMRCAVTAVDNTKKKPRIRINAVLTGGATKASKVHQEFDWIFHRPLPPEAQIQNGKILRTRAGDKFRYDLVLTVKLPETDVLDASKLSGAIGIDVGFRRQGNTILIGTLMSDASNTAAQEITVPPQMISAMEHIIELQSELDNAATDLGKAITPLLKQNALPEDHEKYRMCSSVANRPAHVTLSFDQTYKFAIWLKHEPDVFPYEITEKVYTWW